MNTVWEGGLLLKNSLFPTKLLLTEGEVDVVDNLMKVGIGQTSLYWADIYL